MALTSKRGGEMDKEEWHRARCGLPTKEDKRKRSLVEQGVKPDGQLILEGQRHCDSDEGTVSDNPYKKGTREWNLWLQGYAEKFWQDFDQEPA